MVVRSVTEHTNPRKGEGSGEEKRYLVIFASDRVNISSQ